MRTRQQPRNQLDAQGHVRTSRGMQWDVVLTDISENGCRVQLPHGTLMNGEIVKLFVSGSGPHRARVHWREGHEAGVKFDRPFTPALIEQIRSGLAVVPASNQPSDPVPVFGQRAASGPLRFV